jgi:nicotinate-nucleotide adenylyltransferase
VQSIGILGGTFDPIHYGHLRPADAVRQRLGLAEVRLLPAGKPPHRGHPETSATHRLRMVELAVAEFPGLVADGCELKRPGPSYTVDTLRVLRDELGSQPLCLLMGSDAFIELESWHEWEQLPELAHLIVMERPGYVAGTWPVWAEARRCRNEAAIHEKSAGCVHLVPVPQLDLSATRVRESLRLQQSVEKMLPLAVIDYIHTHHLYSV